MSCFILTEDKCKQKVPRLPFIVPFLSWLWSQISVQNGWTAVTLDADVWHYATIINGICVQWHLHKMSFVNMTAFTEDFASVPFIRIKRIHFTSLYYYSISLHHIIFVGWPFLGSFLIFRLWTFVTPQHFLWHMTIIKLPAGPHFVAPRFSLSSKDGHLGKEFCLEIYVDYHKLSIAFHIGAFRIGCK